MATEAVKITKKGQVTIPKKIRDRLKATEVYFEVVNDEIVVRAVRDAAGSLSEYARNVDPDISIAQIKGQPQLTACFDQTLGFIKSAVDANASKACYLHGSFGSGKSHFMATLRLL